MVITFSTHNARFMYILALLALIIIFAGFSEENKKVFLFGGNSFGGAVWWWMNASCFYSTKIFSLKLSLRRYIPTHAFFYLLVWWCQCHWLSGRVLERKVIYSRFLFHVLLVAILRFDFRKWKFLLECFEGKTKESLETKRVSLERRRETLLVLVW